MDAPCKIQGSIHVFRLVNNMCPGKWVHINESLMKCVFYFLFFSLYFLNKKQRLIMQKRLTNQNKIYICYLIINKMRKFNSQAIFIIL